VYLWSKLFALYSCKDSISSSSFLIFGTKTTHKKRHESKEEEKKRERKAFDDNSGSGINENFLLETVRGCQKRSVYMIRLSKLQGH